MLESDSRLRFELALQKSRFAVYSTALPLAVLFTGTGLYQIPFSAAASLWLTASLSALIFASLYRTGVDRRLGINLRPVWMVIDVLLVTGVIYFDGGETSIWFILYLPGVAGAAFTDGKRAVNLMILATAAAYIGLLVFMGQIRSFDFHLFNAFGRLAILFGSAFFSLRAITKIQKKRHLIKELRVADEKKVKQLTDLTRELEIQRQELAEKARQVEEANRLKSEFLANMSHELRTPMNSIIGFTQILVEKLSGTIEPQHLKFLKNVLGSGRHLLGLINTMLDLSKIEAGKMDLFPEDIDLGKSISQTVDIMRASAQSRRIEIIQEVPDPAPTLIADAAKLEQVLLNLLSNAIKFSPCDSTVRIRVSEINGDEAPLGREAVRIDVIDQGPGIEADLHEAVFEEFRQLQGGANRPEEGTGLGLTLVKKILELQEGTITLDSAPGRGSTFSAILPKIPTTASPIPEEKLAVTEILESHGAPSGRPRVLVVEDDPNAAQLLANTLENAGYSVVQVRRGEDALQVAERDPPEVITLDLLLPGIDGWEVLRRLKHMPTTKSIPVVIVSMVSDSSLAVTLGADDFFVKPVPHEILVQRVQDLVGPNAPQTEKSVLLIDDDPAVHEIFAASTEGLDLRVLSALEPMQGIEIAQTIQPDVIVLDIMMPRMNGFEVAARLRADPTTATIPIIILTALDLLERDRERLHGQIVSLQQKVHPWPMELVETIDGLLRRRH